VRGRRRAARTHRRRTSASSCSTTWSTSSKKAGAASSDAVKAELAKQKQAVSEAKAAEFVDACTKKTARSRIECALAAADLEGVAKCDDVK
jgi:hypothetical protein